MHGNRRFRILRGVKQGDVLSPLLFNAGLEAATHSWKSRIAGCGIHVSHIERLTNISLCRCPDGLQHIVI